MRRFLKNIKAEFSKIATGEKQQSQCTDKIKKTDKSPIQANLDN